MIAKAVAAPKAARAANEDEIKPGKLKRLIISNFRGIRKPVTIDLDNILVLVGPNNAGKSSILRAYEMIMQDGSKDGYMSLQDFPDSKPDPDNPTIIELHTSAMSRPPGNKWIGEADGELIVKERWVWKTTGPGTRQGWNYQKTGGAGWDDKEVPWGAANVANSGRPQPHWVKAFDTPEEQAEKINKLITTMITEKAKDIPVESGDKKEDGSPVTEFERLLELLGKFQERAFNQTKLDVEDIEKRLTEMVAGVFSDHVIKFILHPPLDKDIKLFSAGSTLSVGHKDGWRGPLQNQGSGARRTILWAVLRVLSEQMNKTSERPRVLLIDEPELCLHPDAIREACKVLYDLAEKAGWQVIVTTHSPVFIDLSRDNTTVVRVERLKTGEVTGTTLFRPEIAKLGADDRENLLLLNCYDPYVAEFFFGGRVIVVEGDTEYSAFQYLIAKVNEGKIDGVSPSDVSNVQIIRARGKYPIISLCKILNHFGTTYSVLHDLDTPTITTKKGKEQANPAWAANSQILDVVFHAPDPDRIRVLASQHNFETAFLEDEAKTDKPYNAIRALKDNEEKLKLIHTLFLSLIDHKAPIPKGAVDAKGARKKAA